MEKEIKRGEILKFTTPQRDGKIYFVSALSQIGSYKVQRAVIETEAALMQVSDTIREELKAYKTDEERRDLLESPCTLTISNPVELTEPELESLKPGYDMLKCLQVILKA